MMTADRPRFEFRIFAPSLDGPAAALRRRAVALGEDGGEERYILAAGVDSENVKYRGGQIEIKHLQEVHMRLERWVPTAIARFPLSHNFVASAILPALRVDRFELPRSAYSEAALFEELVPACPTLFAVRVSKRRQRFELGGCTSEIVELKFEEREVVSVAAESNDPDALAALIASLGIGDRENLSYPRALRRLSGLPE